MGSEQSSHASPASAANTPSVKPRSGGNSGGGKNYAYLSPIGSNENIDTSGAAGGVNGVDATPDDAVNKRLSAPNGTSRPNDVSPAVEASKVPTLQAQLQAKVSAHVVSGTEKTKGLLMFVYLAL